jgi:3-oxoacyl-[acyl-carrier-protein] synthase II
MADALAPAPAAMPTAATPLAAAPGSSGRVVRRGAGRVVVSGVSVTSVFGRGLGPLLAAVGQGRAGFAPVERFDVSGRRVGVAAVLPGAPVLADELARTVAEACDDAGLSSAQRAETALFLALHGDPDLARAAAADRPRHGADAFAGRVALRSGLSGVVRAYTSACVAPATAVADAAALIARGQVARVVVAAGYLVDADQFALFDAGRALAADGRMRPFSAGRGGTLLGDAVAALVLQGAPARSADGVFGRVLGWGRAGDAFHVCRPRPDGAGLARAIGDALARAGVGPGQVGYVNAHGSGSVYGDAAEAAGLRLALGGHADSVPVSSSKSVHGQALEASGLLELAVTLGALRGGPLPVNAGYLGPDPGCALNLVLEPAGAHDARYALSVNSAFGGANTALLVGAP